MIKVKYRYRLERVLDPTNPKTACVIMLNPSTADDNVNDPTIMSLIRILTHNGYGRFTVANIFGVRATDPRRLKELQYNGVDLWGGPEMVQERRRLIAEADDVIVAWGNTDIKWAGFEPRDTYDDIVVHAKLPPMCFGKNMSGTPKHPLYLPTDTMLVGY